MKKLSLLGSTGSIGTQALQVVQNLREQGEKWEVAALAARSSVNRLLLPATGSFQHLLIWNHKG